MNNQSVPESFLDFDSGKLGMRVLNRTQAMDSRGIKRTLEYVTETGGTFDEAAVYMAAGAKKYQIRLARLLGVPVPIIYGISDEASRLISINLNDFSDFSVASEGWEVTSAYCYPPENSHEGVGSYAFTQKRQIKFPAPRGASSNSKWEPVLKGRAIELTLNGRFRVTGGCEPGTEELEVENFGMGYVLSVEYEASESERFSTRRVSLTRSERTELEIDVRAPPKDSGIEGISLSPTHNSSGRQPFIFERKFEETGSEKNVRNKEGCTFNVIGSLEKVTYADERDHRFGIGVRDLSGRKIRGVAGLKNLHDKGTIPLDTLFALSFFPAMEDRRSIVDVVATVTALKPFFANPNLTEHDFYQLEGFRQIAFGDKIRY